MNKINFKKRKLGSKYVELVLRKIERVGCGYKQIDSTQRQTFQLVNKNIVRIKACYLPPKIR